jgi:hypothetical protein
LIQAGGGTILLNTYKLTWQTTARDWRLFRRKIEMRKTYSSVLSTQFVILLALTLTLIAQCNAYAKEHRRDVVTVERVHVHRVKVARVRRDRARKAFVDPSNMVASVPSGPIITPTAVVVDHPAAAEQLVVSPQVTGIAVSGDSDDDGSDGSPLEIINATRPHDAEALHKGDYNHLRPAPDRHSPIVMKMPEGTPFQVTAYAHGGTADKGGYFKVVLSDGTIGWTSKANVRFLN